MTRTQAYRVLGLTEDADRAEIKSRYRQLMHKLHPDSRSEEKENYPYSAREINEAYGILVKGKGAKDSFIRGTKESTTSKAEWEAKRQHRQKKNWNAPENPHAYCIRNIYQYVEDADGAVIGEFVITEGKYLWTIEEDFPLFLKSIFACSNRLLQEIEAKLEKSVREEERLKVQAELTYLLAQQFIDAPEILGHFAEPGRKKEAEDEIFYFAAMLELMDTVNDMRAGTPLFPAALKQHRLFLKKQSGEAAGYLSLKDDRLYYILVPLLEQKRAMVKIQVAAKQDRANMRGRKRYKNLDFWIKVPRKYAGTFPESIGLQIENLLLSYEKKIHAGSEL
ncbi:MAG: J domain-containing protein [Roseburia sp.]